MAINTGTTGTKYLIADADSAIIGLDTKTIIFWINPNALNGGGVTSRVAGLSNLSTSSAWIVDISNLGEIVYDHTFSTTTGVWYVPAATAALAVGVKNQIAVSYDRTSVSNNPLIYFNGVSKAVTRSTAPVGTPASETGLQLKMYTSSANAAQLYALVEDFRIYNRIMTASEILTLYGSGTPNNLMTNDSGLVFQAPMLYAENRYPTIPFAGTIGATDYTYDRINGIKMTATGSPVGAAAIAYTGFGF